MIRRLVQWTVAGLGGAEELVELVVFGYLWQGPLEGGNRSVSRVVREK